MQDKTLLISCALAAVFSLAAMSDVATARQGRG